MELQVNEERYFSKLSLFKFILLFLLSIVVSAILVVPYGILTMTLPPFAASEALLVFLSSFGLYLGVMVLIWWWSLTREDRYLIMKPAPARSSRHIGFILAPFLLGLPVNILYILLLERLAPDFLEKMMDAGNLPENFLASPDPLSLILLFLAVVVMAPIVEEIAFRGVLYNLLNLTMPLWLSAVISSAIFGLLHGTTFLQTAIIGFILAFVYQVTGDLKMAMLGHALNNFLAFLQAVLLSQGIIAEGQTSEVIFTSLLLVMGLTMIIASVSYFRRNKLSAIYNDRSPIYKHEIWASQTMNRPLSNPPTQNIFQA